MTIPSRPFPFLLLVSFVLGASGASPAARAQGEYRVGAGDVLAIDVRGGGGEGTAVKVTVSGDGTASVAEAGSVEMAGRTTPEIEAAVERKLRERGIYRDPHVTVNVEEYRSQCVNVAGMVASPSRICLRRTDTRLLDVIAEAGGVVEDTAGDVIRIMREGSSEPLRIKRHHLHGADVEKAREANIVVQADDNIYVPAKQFVCILGAVDKPDCYPLEEGMTLLQAISRAGSLSEAEERKADRSKIVIRRRDDVGMKEIVVDLDALPGGEAPLLQADDQIVVPMKDEEAPELVTVSGTVKEAGTFEWHEGMTLIDAIALAGGSETEFLGGDLGKVTLLRGGQTRHYNVKRMMKGRTEDVPLLPGDRIFVPKRFL